MSTTIAGGWPPSPANDPGIRKVVPSTYIVYNDPYDQKYHAVADGSLGLPGTDYVNSDASTVINSALAAGGRTHIVKATYPINTQLNMVSNGELWLEQGTILKANSSISAVIGFSGSSISRSRINGGRIDCNSLATNGINWNQTEISAINRIDNLVVSSSTGKAMVLDGNEDTLVKFCLVESSCADGISFITPFGQGMFEQLISNVPLTGVDLAGRWQIACITDSVLNTIDCGRSEVTDVKGCYMANQAATVKSTDVTGPRVISITKSYIGLGSGNPNFVNVTKLQNALSIKDSHFIALDGTNTFLVNVLGTVAQSSANLENLARSATTIKPEASTNVMYVFGRNIFSKGANGIFTNSVDETNKIISFYTGTQSTAATASTDYTIKTGSCKLTVSGGTGVSITLKDGNATTIVSGVATLTRELCLPGYKINFGAFSGAPTVLAEWI